MSEPQHTMNLKDNLQRLFQGEIISKAEMKSILLAIGQGKVNPYQISAFLTCFKFRPITGEELSGIREAMIELAVYVDFSDLDTIDLCGTGGDGKNTFNISSVASFLVAGAGYKVAKHGNYGVSSGCGSSNVLEFLGYTLSNDYAQLRKQIETANFCYMHAPLFHPAMKEVGAIRKGLNFKTFFNMIGPLLNPARPSRQLTGVFSEDLMPLYKTVFEDMGISYAVIRSNDGYDEISLTGTFKIRSNKFDGEMSPEELGQSRISAEDLHGGNTVEEAAKIFMDILEGNGTDVQNAVVCTNAGMGIQRFKPEVSATDCIAEAKAALESGKALEMLKRVIN